ncbi:ABC transporter permease [Desnuesiella massiliensis]|uniref:ABC transporter permease n=1 Tax=Desnuesiella massiliensis TaxID=1650662 RepID=UPI0006E39AAF|nr:ABC transporter permease [Desnuesiella massiliensis]
MNIFYIAALHLNRIFNDKKVIIIMFIIPAIIISFFSLMSKKSGDLKINPIKIGIVNKDERTSSQELIDYLKESKKFNMSFFNEEDGLKALGQNKVQALLIISKDFSEKLSQKSMPELEIKKPKEGSTYLSLMQSVNSFLGKKLYNKSSEVTKEVLSDSSDRVNFNPIIPNFIMNFVLFSMIYITNELLEMKSNKTLLRSFSTPNSKIKILLSVLLSMFLLLTLQTLILIGISKYIFKFYWGSSFIGLLLVVFALVYVALSIGLLVSRFAKNQGQVAGFVNLIVTPTCIISGSFMPQEFLPEVFKKLAYFTPQNWSSNAITDLALKNAGIINILPNVIVLLLFGTAFLTASQYIVKAE